MNVGIRFLCAALVLTTSTWAVGQTAAPPQNPAINDADKAFAAKLAEMTLEESKAAIAKAPPAQITDGLALALQALAGEAIMNVKHPEPALPLFMKALDVATRVGDVKLAAAVTYGIGNSYRFTGDNDNALIQYTRAEALAMSVAPATLELAKIHSARAVLRLDLGDLDGSTEDGNNALREYKELGDDVDMARALNNLGNTELARANFTGARQDFEEGLKLARKTHQRLGEAFLLNNISNTYLQQENILLATDYCLQSIKIKEELGNKENLVTSLTNLARIYQHSGRIPEALQTTQRAWTLAKELGRPMEMALVLAVWGSIETDQKHYASALERLREGYELTLKSGDRMHGNEMLVQVAEAELHNSQYEDAVRDASKALEGARAMQFQKNIESSASVVGVAEEKLGRLAAAKVALEESIAAVEKMRQDAAGGEQAAAAYFSNQINVHQALAAVDVAQGKWEEAFLTSEREKGRALLDLLTHGRSAAASGLTAKERNEASTLRTRVSKLTQQRTAESMDGTPDAAAIAAIDRRLKTAHDALTLFDERMSVAHPDMKRHRGEAQLITLAQTAELLPSASTAVLEYEVTPDATYLFTIARGRDGPVLHGYTIPVTEAALKKRVGAFHTALMSRDPGFATSARSLYQLLIAPAARDLVGKRRVILVPSGELWHLPFQALQNSAGRYLIDDFSISSAPSLSVLRAYAVKRGAASAPSLVAFGDPAGDLPEAAREVQAVAALFERPRAKTFLRGSATLENYRTSALRGDGQEILLATHGVYNDKNPMDSYLVLASANPADGAKTVQMDASQVADMKIKANLVVLSACDTAEGKYLAGEGLVGLGWSFLAAGSQSAIASQWRVESSSTTELMIAFHRGLQENLGRAGALRKAELSLAHGERYKHPFYWAGFVLLGSN